MKKHLLSLVGILLIGGYALSKTFVDARMKIRKANSEDIRFLPTARTLKILSFGFEPAVADVYWIEAINYFGSELVSPHRTLKYLQPYSEIILELDPYFSSFYEWAGTAFIYNGLPIDHNAIVHSMEFVNLGIQNFHKIYRYDPDMILKGAFNYALEAHNPIPSIAYYQMAARIFPERRDMLLVASTWASSANELNLSTDLKLEFLSTVAFEAQTRDELVYALRVLSSANFNNQSASIIRSLRVKMEKDEEIKQMVEKRLKDRPLFKNENLQSAAITDDPRLDNILNVDFSRTWMPAELLTLLSL